jgi:hypothetical protein
MNTDTSSQKKNNNERNTTPVQGMTDDDITSLKEILVNKKCSHNVEWEEEDYEVELKQTIKASPSCHGCRTGKDDRKLRHRSSSKDKTSYSSHDHGDDYFDLYVNRQNYWDSKISALTLQEDIVEEIYPVNKSNLNSPIQGDLAAFTNTDSPQQVMTQRDSQENFHDLLLLPLEIDSIQSEITLEPWKSLNDPCMMSADNSSASENSMDVVEFQSNEKMDDTHQSKERN